MVIMLFAQKKMEAKADDGYNKHSKWFSLE